MSSLQSLIRIHRWQLDEKRRALTDLESLSDRLSQEMRRLEEELGRERQSINSDPQSAADFAAYLKAVKKRREHLSASKAQIEQQIAAASKEIAEAYRELKKFEIAQSDRDRNAHVRLRRREAAIFDEIATTGHRRKSGS
ncbi:MAG: hypothetical protein HKM95_11675 [Inquilinus sp.]|nr:hypothetical protein [Inquilinus sp.]